MNTLDANSDQVANNKPLVTASGSSSTATRGDWRPFIFCHAETLSCVSHLQGVAENFSAQPARRSKQVGNATHVIGLPSHTGLITAYQASNGACALIPFAAVRPSKLPHGSEPSVGCKRTVANLLCKRGALNKHCNPRGNSVSSIIDLGIPLLGVGHPELPSDKWCEHRWHSILSTRFASGGLPEPVPVIRPSPTGTGSI